MVQILWKAVSKVGQTASVTTYFLRKSFPLFFSQQSQKNTTVAELLTATAVWTL